MTTSEQWDRIYYREREEQAAEALRDSLAQRDGDMGTWLKGQMAVLARSTNPQHRAMRKAYDTAESAVYRAWPTRGTEGNTPEKMLTIAQETLTALAAEAERSGDIVGAKSIRYFLRRLKDAGDKAAAASRAEYDDDFLRTFKRDLPW